MPTSTKISAKRNIIEFNIDSIAEQEFIIWSGGEFVPTAVTPGGDSGNGSIRRVIDIGDTITVLDEHSMVVVDYYEINGTLDLQGDAVLEILGGDDFVLTTGDIMTGALVITPAVDALSIFQVEQTDSTPVFSIDTTNARVGIGTDTPGFNLEVSGSSNPAIVVTDTTNTVQAQLRSFDTSANVGTRSSHQFAIISSNASRIVIASGGDVTLKNNVTIGSGATGVDYILTFDGETNDGVITWMEDEDYFLFNDDVMMGDGKNIILDTTIGTKIGTSTSQKLGFFDITPIIQPTVLTTALTQITHTGPSSPDYVIATPISSSSWGFSTQDEFETVMSVVLNIQTRLDETESKLQALGLLA